VTSGRVIVLQGTSSSGKTTLAAAVQDRLLATGACWIVTGVDEWFAHLPRAWTGIDDRRGPHADDGIVFDTRGGFEMRMGEVGRALLRAYRASVGAMAREGINVIVDDSMLREEEWVSWQQATDGLDVLWVRVHLDLGVVEARERARPDRVLGMARWQYDLVHRFATYDVEVDTGALGPDEAAAVVVGAL
jgi:chloramphenicol 3-O phosphotransferase